MTTNLPTAKLGARTTAVACAVLAALLLAASVEAQIPMIPTPVIVAQSDLIAAVKVDKVSDVTEQTLVLPEPHDEGSAQPANPTKAFFRTFSGTIEKIQRDVSGKAKVGDKIELLAMAPRPVQPGAIQMAMTDGPAYPGLTEGKSYQLLLHSMNDGKRYYLPSYFKNFKPADAVEKNAVEGIDVEQWPWGKADASGLQMAVLLDPEVIAARAWPSRQGGEKVTMVSAMFALRNTSAKPLRITADPSLKPISIQMTTADGKPAGEAVNLYGDKIQLPPNAAEPITLGARELVFVSEAGPCKWFSRISTKLEPGEYEIAAGYSVDVKALTPQAPGVKSESIWIGKLEAPAVKFKVVANPELR